MPYGALGCTLVWHGLLVRRERRLDEAREQTVHGLVLMLLSVL